LENRIGVFCVISENKNPMMQRVLALLFLCGCFSCVKDNAAEKLIDNSIRAIMNGETSRSFITEAECKGPKGTYRTIVHSAPDYTYFKQTFSYSNDPFEAVIVGDSAFQIVNDSVAGSFGKEVIAALKSHEFHMILIDLKHRYHQFSEREYVSDQPKVGALDELNNPIEILFRKGVPEVQSITMRNPSDTTERITFSYTNWTVIRGMKLPLHVMIKQGADKVFTFDFTKVEVNSENFKKKR
jgi:hypothetical protein